MGYITTFVSSVSYLKGEIFVFQNNYPIEKKFHRTINFLTENIKNPIEFSLNQEECFCCKNFFQTGNFPIGNLDILSDFIILLKFCSNDIGILIPI